MDKVIFYLSYKKKDLLFRGLFYIIIIYYKDLKGKYGAFIHFTNVEANPYRN